MIGLRTTVRHWPVAGRHTPGIFYPVVAVRARVNDGKISVPAALTVLEFRRVESLFRQQELEVRCSYRARNLLAVRREPPCVALALALRVFARQAHLSDVHE